MRKPGLGQLIGLGTGRLEEFSCHDAACIDERMGRPSGNEAAASGW